ncbi:erythromycin esterase family protein [Oceanobacillus chungangensis]|uniref:Erythromycin esterase n=1 Tax=Oceanobacillus chungangensis TaxID=1229152 RepID=A0A3D8PXK4_9BACI|nr:erythromycin esterase family protein [Oceanobacillus chungangensis]RDW20502.1 erythromycin esterase [Oceanobacillus chungangensis]
MSLFQLGNKKYNKATEWVREHSFRIESLTECNGEDFKFLEKVLKDKRVVWLGENGHGIAEHSLLKTKLIHFLYQKMGFKVIAFESGFVEGYSSNYMKEALSVNELMDKSIFSLWKTEETYPLFELIKENSDLNLIGFDLQPSVKKSSIVAFINQLNINFPSEFIRSIQKVENTAISFYEQIGIYKATRKKVPKEILNNYFKTKKEQDKLIIHLQTMLKYLKREFERNGLSKEYAVIQKALENRQLFLNHLASRKRDFLKIRDRVMADNLEWICNELYPNEKIIIWAHNNHIYKNITSSYKPMGSLMSPKFERQSYYLGLFMYQGEVTFDKKTTQKLEKPPKNSIEDYMNHNPSPVSFLDFSKASLNRVNKWISRNTVILDSGMIHTFIIPKKQLDGIFFVKEVSPSRHI